LDGIISKPVTNLQNPYSNHYLIPPKSTPTTVKPTETLTNIYLFMP